MVGLIRNEGSSIRSGLHTFVGAEHLIEVLAKVVVRVHPTLQNPLQTRDSQLPRCNVLPMGRRDWSSMRKTEDLARTGRSLEPIWVIYSCTKSGLRFPAMWLLEVKEEYCGAQYEKNHDVRARSILRRSS